MFLPWSRRPSGGDLREDEEERVKELAAAKDLPSLTEAVKYELTDADVKEEKEPCSDPRLELGEGYRYRLVRLNLSAYLCHIGTPGKIEL